MARAAPAQRSTWLPGLASGEHFSTAHTEVDARRPAANLQTAHGRRAVALGAVGSARARRAGRALGGQLCRRDQDVRAQKSMSARGINISGRGQHAGGAGDGRYKVYDGSRAGDLPARRCRARRARRHRGEGLAAGALIDLGIVAACADALGAMGALLRKTGECT